MATPHLANAVDLEQWADRISSRYDLPDLIRRLVLATSEPAQVDFRAQEGTGYGGWDGRVEISDGTAYVPSGTSGWKMGAGKKPQAKANRDYRKRTGDPTPFTRANTTFVFCTPRRWSKKEEWLEKKREEE